MKITANFKHLLTLAKNDGYTHVWVTARQVKATTYCDIYKIDCLLALRDGITQTTDRGHAARHSNTRHLPEKSIQYCSVFYKYGDKR